MSDTASKSMGFIAAMVDFFGTLPNQTKLQLGAQIKALSEADKAYFRAGLESVGYTISP